MENIVNESGKARELNIYADLFEEEFIAIRSKESSVLDTDADKVTESNSQIEVATEADVEVASNVNTVNAEEKEEAEVDVRSAYIDWCKEFGKEASAEVNLLLLVVITQVLCIKQFSLFCLSLLFKLIPPQKIIN